jgi:hypothetical protein
MVRPDLGHCSLCQSRIPAISPSRNFASRHPPELLTVALVAIPPYTPPAYPMLVLYGAPSAFRARIRR